MRTDFSLANDLAAKNPKKLTEMQALFMKEAEKHHVLPIDDRVFERAIAAMVGRPDLMAGRTSLTLAEGMTGMMENVFINVKNKSKTITAEVEVPASGANGTILAQGGRFGGWALYVKDGVPAYDYNFLGLKHYTIASTKPLAPGKATIRFDFAYDGGGLGKGGTGTLFVNNEKVAEGRIEHTQAMMFSADETADVGIDLGTPVVEAIGSEAKSRFTGRIPKVTVEVKEDDSGRQGGGGEGPKGSRSQEGDVGLNRSGRTSTNPVPRYAALLRIVDDRQRSVRRLRRVPTGTRFVARYLDHLSCKTPISPRKRRLSARGLQSLWGTGLWHTVATARPGVKPMGEVIPHPRRPLLRSRRPAPSSQAGCRRPQGLPAR